jgi:hypothetical protein
MFVYSFIHDRPDLIMYQGHGKWLRTVTMTKL